MNRDEELQAGAASADNCDLFRALITEIEDLVLSLQCKAIESDDLRAELSALKAQEPVGSIEIQGTGFLCAPFPAPAWAGGRQPAVGTKLYAAPVSEAKAQGVVMPDVNAAAKALCNRHAIICGVDADDQWKEYSQEFIEDAETVLANARLNAAPAQQVSVPDGWRELAKRADDFLYSLPETDGVLRLRADLCSMLAAPAAPAADAHSWRRKEGVNGIKEFMAQKCYDAQTDAIKKYYEPFKCANCKAADASDVLEQAMYTLISIGYHENSGLVHELRQALAAHRAKGVV